MKEISVADLLELYFALNRKSLSINVEPFDKKYLKISLYGLLRCDGTLINNDFLIRKGAYNQVKQQLIIADLDLKCLWKC